MRIAMLAAALMVSVFAGQADAAPVDVELSLLIDVSGSVSTSEFNLQRNGYVSAFQSGAVHSAISSGPEGAIAVNLIYWSSSSSQVESVGWTLIDSAASANAFAATVGATPRPFGGGTSIGPAINFAVPRFDNNGFEGTRLVIDVSGDGSSTTSTTRAARDAAEAAGITINGLPIGGSTFVENFYTDSVITSDGFITPAASFADFAGAVETKLVTEIRGGDVPEPSLLALLGAGAAGLFFVRRRRNA